MRDVRKYFRGVKALDGVSLTVQPGEILGLIGPNGSGKTTLLNVISGVLKPTSGSVAIDGSDATGRPVHRIAALGVARTFQQIRLFRAMSVAENVEVGAVARGLHPEGVSTIPRILARSRVADYASWPAGMLSYGRRRMVEIARALAGRPRLLLLDEPAAGMNEAESDSLLLPPRDPRGGGVRRRDRRPRPAPDHATLRSGHILARGAPTQTACRPSPA